MKIIKIGPNRLNLFAKVSDMDYERVSAYKWHAQKTGHSGGYRVKRNFWIPSKTKKTNIRAYGRNRTVNGYYKSVFLHRFILNPPDKMLVDHINGDAVDNRRENLRIVNSTQNCMNSSPRYNSRSGFRGVTWDSQTRKWRAIITYGGKTKSLGRFKDIAEAMNARVDAEKCDVRAILLF